MNKTQKIESVMEVVRILVSLILAYGVALIILFAISDEPVFIVQQFIAGPFSSARRIGSIINLAVPFTICGLSMCFMYAVNKFNLIGEGIFMLSACMVTWVSLSLQSLNLPAAVMVPIMYVVAILTGVVMAFIPAIMDRKFNANVVVVSLMPVSYTHLDVYKRHAWTCPTARPGPRWACWRWRWSPPPSTPTRPPRAPTPCAS